MISTQLIGPDAAFASVQERFTDLGRQFDIGNWTPTVGGNTTYTEQIGLYQRIGNLVNLQADLTINILGTGSPTTLTGIPFPHDTRTGYAGTVSYWSGLPASYVFVSCFIIRATGAISFSGATAATATLTAGITAFQDGTRVLFNLSYYKR